MRNLARILYAAVWIAFGCLCFYPIALGTTDGFHVAVAGFGAIAILNAVACAFRWRFWLISSPILGVLLLLYALDVLILGHAEDVGGLIPWLAFFTIPLGLGVWSIVFPMLDLMGRRNAQPSTGGNR